MLGPSIPWTELAGATKQPAPSLDRNKGEARLSRRFSPKVPSGKHPEGNAPRRGRLQQWSGGLLVLGIIQMGKGVSAHHLPLPRTPSAWLPRASAEGAFYPRLQTLTAPPASPELLSTLPLLTLF